MIPKNVNKHLTFNVLHSENVVVFRCSIVYNSHGNASDDLPDQPGFGDVQGRVKMHCTRCVLKEVSIVGRVFLANGEPKFPNGRETRKSLA